MHNLLIDRYIFKNWLVFKKTFDFYNRRCWSWKNTDIFFFFTRDSINDFAHYKCMYDYIVYLRKKKTKINRNGQSLTIVDNYDTAALQIVDLHRSWQNPSNDHFLFCQINFQLCHHHHRNKSIFYEKNRSFFLQGMVCIDSNVVFLQTKNIKEIPCVTNDRKSLEKMLQLGRKDNRRNTQKYLQIHIFRCNRLQTDRKKSIIFNFYINCIYVWYTIRIGRSFCFIPLKRR